MLPRLVLCLCVGALDARDWSQISQEALSWGVDDTNQKQKYTKEDGTPKGLKGTKGGCPVEESCSGDFVPKGGFTPERDFVPPVNPNERNPEWGHEVAEQRHEVLVFVSFSMPEASLKSLFHEASKHKAVLVMRGLYENSFVKTAAKLQQMGITVDIHPELFEKYHVERVPVFVRLDKGREIARLSGNVSLDFAVSKLAEVS